MEKELRHSQKLEAVALATAKIAHDFNNNLTVIMGYLDIAAESTSKDEMDEALIEAKVACGKAAALTSGLLEFGRKKTTTTEVVNLNEQVRQIAQLIRSMLNPDIEFETLLDADADTVGIEPVAIDQLVMNLTVNAADAMPGGGSLTISTRNVAVSSQDNPEDPPPGSYVVLEVADSGSGIDAQLQPLIFEPFLTTKPEGKGTGLGLSTVKEIVNAAGGYIALESAEVRGTVFRIFFEPADAPDRARTVAEEEEVTPGSASVLIVDDDPQIRGLLEKMLARGGREVACTRDAEHALALSEVRPFDVLITDLTMPGISGIELANKLYESLPDLRVIVLSGQDVGSALESCHIPPDQLRFIRKPVSAKELVRTVETLTRGNAP